jgi:hypothetical protein
MLVGYMRGSSDNDRQTTDLQRNALLAAGVDPRHLFAEKASGARDDRSGLQQALDYVRPGDCLVVWKLDRLGCSLSHLFHIITTLQAQGVAFRSLTKQMDTTTPQGAFLLSVFGVLAQYERALTQERIRAGGRTTPREMMGDGLRRSALNNWRPSSPPCMREPAKPPSAGRSGVKRTTLYDALACAAAQTVPLIKGGA